MIEHLDDEQLIDYVYRNLSDTQRFAMDQHLAACPDCRARLTEHTALDRRIHYTIIARRHEPVPAARLTYAAIAPHVKRPNPVAHFGRRLNGALAAAAFLALVILLIGLFGSARQAAVGVRPTPTPTAAPVTPTAAPAPKLIWKIEGYSALKSPAGLALDRQGNLYAVDAGNGHILKFDRDGKLLSQWGSLGDGDGQFTFASVMGWGEYNAEVAVDSLGNVYVADTANARIQKFDNNGKFLMKWGSAGDGPGQFKNMTSIAVDSQDNVYVAEDAPQSRIQKFDSNGQFLLQWNSQRSVNGLPFSPNDIAIDHQDFVYGVDLASSSVQKFDRNGQFITSWIVQCGGRNVAVSLNSIALDPTGNVYVGDGQSGRICKYDRNTQFAAQWYLDSIGGGPLSLLLGIVVDPQGDVYVAETDNHRVLKFSPP